VTYNKAFLHELAGQIPSSLTDQKEKMGTKATTPKTKSAKGQSKAGLDKITDYHFDKAKRKNNPSAKIAAEGTVPLLPKIPYEYSPRLAPSLRFDPTGTPDKLPELGNEWHSLPLWMREPFVINNGLWSRHVIADLLGYMTEQQF
jgi:hypothetical protein